MYEISEFLQQAVEANLIDEAQLTEQIRSELFVGSALFTLFPNHVASFDIEFLDNVNELFDTIANITQGELAFTKAERLDTHHFQIR